MDALLLENVTKTFGSVRAVDGLSVRVPSGCICGFLGPNGAGKTTTLRMLINILLPDSGRIEVLGQNPGGGIADRVGYMPEERGLYRKMKVRALLSYFGALKGMSRAALAHETARWLEEIELSGRAHRTVESLSRGMQQKLQFAITAIHDPDLLILDEPFSGLDPITRDMIEGIVLRLRAAGKTIVFSTHVMEQAERLCDHILLINRGAKVLDDTLAAIRSRYRSHAVEAELEGDASFVGALPMVRAVSASNGRLDIALRDGADTQELLRALVGRVRVQSFREKVPSLHEIFVRLVGENNG